MKSLRKEQIKELSEFIRENNIHDPYSDTVIMKIHSNKDIEEFESWRNIVSFVGMDNISRGIKCVLSTCISSESQGLEPSIETQNPLFGFLDNNDIIYDCEINNFNGKQTFKNGSPYDCFHMVILSIVFRDLSEIRKLINFIKLVNGERWIDDINFCDDNLLKYYIKNYVKRCTF